MDRRLDNLAAALADAGCGTDAAAKAERLLTAGRTQELIVHLRYCRCGLMDALHESQRRVDRLDRLIRLAKDSAAAAE